MTSDPTKAEKDRQFREEALRWMPEVGRYALSLARDEMEAEDLVQETYLRAYRGWHLYESGTECRGWLFTICRNRYFRDRQRAAREEAHEDPEVEALAAAAVHGAAMQGGYANAFERSDLRESIDKAFRELPDVYRETATLVDQQDLTYEMASVVLGVPVGTVRSRLFRARRLLQEKLLAHARDAGIVTDTDASTREHHQS